MVAHHALLSWGGPVDGRRRWWGILGACGGGVGLEYKELPRQHVEVEEDSWCVAGEKAPFGLRVVPRVVLRAEEGGREPAGVVGVQAVQVLVT